MDQQQDLKKNEKNKKCFPHNAFNVNYQNSSSVVHIQNDHQCKVKIMNNICQRRGNILYKITEIIYEGKKIRIQDTFKIEEYSTQNVLDVKQKDRQKVQSRMKLLKKSFCKPSNSGQRKQKKDKKNVVKNIVKMFVSYLQKKNYTAYQNQMKILLTQEKYNNRLLKEIFYNQIVSKVFYNFLKDTVDEEIQRSHIHDKQTHHQAVEVYRNIMKKNNEINIIEDFDQQIDYLF